MARTPSTMLPLGTKAPDFRLPDFAGQMHALADFRDQSALLVVFICGHCQFVRHIRGEFARYAREYQARGLAVVAINSNDLAAYPQDGPDGMRAGASERRARPTSFSSTQTAGSCIGASSTAAGPETGRP